MKVRSNGSRPNGQHKRNVPQQGEPQLPQPTDCSLRPQSNPAPRQRHIVAPISVTNKSQPVPQEWTTSPDLSGSSDDSTEAEEGCPSHDTQVSDRGSKASRQSVQQGFCLQGCCSPDHEHKADEGNHRNDHTPTRPLPFNFASSIASLAFKGFPPPTRARSDPTHGMQSPKTRHMRMFGNPVQSYDLQESNRLYRRLFENNRSFAADKVAADPDFFKRMSESQSPHYMLVGCSDSRVPPDQLTKTQPGEIFIHRNVANVVVHTDMNFASVLQYAVEVLRVKHVIVMGHYGCGGVKAAMTNTPHGLIDKWLRNIKDVMRLHRSELNAIKDENERFQRLVELNVQESVFNIYKTSILQQAWAEGDKVQVHGWVYNINTGLIKDLHVERSSSWQEIEEIYELNYADTISGQEAQSMHPLRMFRSSFDLTAEIEADKAPKSN